MARQKYTSYQIFQDRNFPQAERGKVEAYTQTAYQCPHSQRALMAQFSDFSERNRIDAAYLGCCDEPVTIFGIQPQFADEMTPPLAKECSQGAQPQPCYQARLQNIGTLTRCTDEGSVLTTGKISIECHQACREFAGIPKTGGTWIGKYGTLTLIGTKGNQALLEYKLNESLRAEVYDNCLDNMTYTEIFCGQAVTFDIYGGLSSPENCYCDCCGNNGLMTPPVLIATPEFSPVGQDIWANTFEMGTLTVTGLCKDYSYWSHFFSFYSDTYVDPPVTGGPYFDPDLRYMTIDYGAAGSAASPVCCGGVFDVAVVDNTCNHVSHPLNSYNFPSMVDGSVAVTETPAGGSAGGAVVLASESVYTLTATPVCSYSASAGMNVSNKLWTESLGSTYDCSESDIGEMQASDGTMTVEITTHIKDTPTCKACCGRAKMEAYATDGCGHTSDKVTYYIYDGYDAGNPWIGWKTFCQNDGAYFHEYKQKVYCDGSLDGTTSLLSGTNHSTMANCITGLELNSPGLCGSGGHPDGTTCCHFAMDLASQTGKVTCATADLCCNWNAPAGGYYTGSWVYGSWGTCCSSTLQP